MKNIVLLTITLIVAVLALTSLAIADVPQMITYQGYLTSSSGDLLDTTVSMIFTIYDTPTGNPGIWYSGIQTVNVENGRFTYQIGSVNPLPDDIFTDTLRWLGIKVGGDDEISPRTKLTSVVYAYHALRSDTAGYALSGGGGGWTDDGTVVRLTTSSDKVGIGTSSPTNMVHIVGSDSNPLLNVEKNGPGRGLRVSTSSACALWVENSGNHGLRVTNANGDGIHVTQAGGLAGYFNGDVDVTGTLSKGGGSFKIDHPLEPENKYLYHSFVESPDMMNVYNGNVTTDANGEAVVELPDYFDALNRDFRYQLTAIGAPGPYLYIAEKIANNRFRIAGGEPGMEVSWQVTGIRKDAFAEANRIQVEVDKPEKDRGKYLHPKAFGLGKEYEVCPEDSTHTEPEQLQGNQK